MNAYTRKLERSQINDLRFYLKKVENLYENKGASTKKKLGRRIKLRGSFYMVSRFIINNQIIKKV